VRRNTFCVCSGVGAGTLSVRPRLTHQFQDSQRHLRRRADERSAWPDRLTVGQATSCGAATMHRRFILIGTATSEKDAGDSSHVIPGLMNDVRCAAPLRRFVTGDNSDWKPQESERTDRCVVDATSRNRWPGVVHRQSIVILLAASRGRISLSEECTSPSKNGTLNPNIVPAGAGRNDFESTPPARLP